MSLRTFLAGVLNASEQIAAEKKKQAALRQKIRELESEIDLQAGEIQLLELQRQEIVNENVLLSKEKAEMQHNIELLQERLEVRDQTIEDLDLVITRNRERVKAEISEAVSHARWAESERK